MISTGLLAAIVADAALDPRHERCGLLLGDPGRIDAFRSVANIATSPANRFELDPAELLAAHKAARIGGPRIMGHYHSHPAGRAEPSVRDAKEAAADEQLWLIVAGNDARLFRAVAKGSIHDAFDPVPMRDDVMPSSSNSHATVARST